MFFSALHCSAFLGRPSVKPYTRQSHGSSNCIQEQVLHFVCGQPHALMLTACNCYTVCSAVHVFCHLSLHHVCICCMPHMLHDSFAARLIRCMTHWLHTLFTAWFVALCTLLRLALAAQCCPPAFCSRRKQNVFLCSFSCILVIAASGN